MGSNLIKLGDVIEIYSGGTPSKKNPSYWNGSIPWVSAKSMDADAINGSVLYITDEGLDSGSRLAESGTILFLTRGSGLFTRIPVIWVDSPVAYNQDIKCLKAKEPSDARFIYHWLVSQRSMFSKMLDVTGIGAGKINTDQLQDMQMFWPDAITRQRITQVADSLIHAIQLNAQTNDYLLEVGDAVFSNALTANGSSVAYRTIDQYCTVKGGKRLPKGSNLTDTANSHPYIRVRDLNDSSVLLLTPDMMYVDDEIQAGIARYIVEEGDVIISVVGTIGLTAYIGDSLHQANLTENCNRLTAFQGDEAAWTYYFLRSAAGQDAIRQGTVGAVQAKLPLKNIKAIEVPFPTDEVYIEAEQVLSGTLKTIQANLKESIVLAELRDTLLPKLMSGEVDVSEIELPIPPNNHLSAD